MRVSPISIDDDGSIQLKAAASELRRELPERRAVRSRVRSPDRRGRQARRLLPKHACAPTLRRRQARHGALNGPRRRARALRLHLREHAGELGVRDAEALAELREGGLRSEDAGAGSGDGSGAWDGAERAEARRVRPGEGQGPQGLARR